MKNLLFVVIMFSGISLLAMNITTTDGIIYRDVKVKSADAISVTVSHLNGISRIYFRETDKNFQKQYGYNLSEDKNGLVQNENRTYLGNRNEPYFNSIIIKERIRKIKISIAQYQDEYQMEHLHKNYSIDGSTALSRTSRIRHLGADTEGLMSPHPFGNQESSGGYQNGYYSEYSGSWVGPRGGVYHYSGTGSGNKVYESRYHGPSYIGPRGGVYHYNRSGHKVYQRR